MDRNPSSAAPESGNHLSELERIQSQAVAYARDLSRAFHAERARARELSAALTELQATYEATLGALVRALDARDTETQDHSQRVVNTTVSLAKLMGVDGALLEATRLGALLHDVGKIGVPDAILRKPGPLTPQEWEKMRRHSALGWQILSGVGFLQEAAKVVLHHHERYDGTGYPAGLRREQIHPGARIFAVADALDAITSDRPYRRARSLEVAKEEIVRNRGTQFDPDVVDALLKLLS